MRTILMMGVTALTLSACSAPTLCFTGLDTVCNEHDYTSASKDNDDDEPLGTRTSTNTPDDSNVPDNDTSDDTGDDTSDDTGGDSDDDATPSGKHGKSDNSDANGKGGNKHDRKDKTKRGTEVAEDKKGV